MSPSLTNHSTTVASGRPSPRSGRWKVLISLIGSYPVVLRLMRLDQFQPARIDAGRPLRGAILVKLFDHELGAVTVDDRADVADAGKTAAIARPQIHRQHGFHAHDIVGPDR